MTSTSGTRDESIVRYDDRLPVRGRALLPAIAAGAGAGLLVFYLARLLLERAPIVLDSTEAVPTGDAARARARG
ncbi:MAG: hypothetical protein ACREMU_11555 [Gemmatimonadaceae bacterium]